MLDYVCTDNQLEDIFTKSLCEERFSYLRRELGIFWWLVMRSQWSSRLKLYVKSTRILEPTWDFLWVDSKLEHRLLKGQKIRFSQITLLPLVFEPTPTTSRTLFLWFLVVLNQPQLQSCLGLRTLARDRARVETLAVSLENLLSKSKTCTLMK